MNIFEIISFKFSEIFGINSSYVNLFLYSFLCIIGIKLVIKLICFINTRINKNEKTLYLINKKTSIFGTILVVIILILIWESKITKLITLISFISAAFALALRDFVYNFFAGLYINICKPFKIEDRIEIDSVIGDVVNINSLTFDLLEVSSKDNGEQSTGIMVHVPNSKVFSGCFKNYTEAFKYIWDEVTIKVSIDSNIKEIKTIIYDIVRGNDIVKKIPRKMKNQLDETVGEYRIYYNKLEPIIYTNVVDGIVYLTVRYLAHPKKARNIRSDIWNSILSASNEGKFKLYQYE